MQSFSVKRLYITDYVSGPYKHGTDVAIQIHSTMEGPPSQLYQPSQQLPIQPPSPQPWL